MHTSVHARGTSNVYVYSYVYQTDEEFTGPGAHSSTFEFLTVNPGVHDLGPYWVYSGISLLYALKFSQDETFADR